MLNREEMFCKLFEVGFLINMFAAAIMTYRVLYVSPERAYYFHREFMQIEGTIEELDEKVNQYIKNQTIMEERQKARTGQKVEL